MYEVILENLMFLFYSWQVNTFHRRRAVLFVLDIEDQNNDTIQKNSDEEKCLFIEKYYYRMAPFQLVNHMIMHIGR